MPYVEFSGPALRLYEKFKIYDYAGQTPLGMKTKEAAAIWRKLAPRFQGLGLVIKGKFVFFSTVDDFVRGLYFEGSSDPTCF